MDIWRAAVSLPLHWTVSILQGKGRRLGVRPFSACPPPSHARAKMTAALFQKVALLLSFLLPDVRPTPCDLSIQPVNPIVPFGGSVTLNCTSSCANDTQLKWESSVQGGIQQADGWTSVSFDNITGWDFQPLCFRGSTQDPVRTLVYLYQFSSPEIHLASDIMAGHWHTIVCNVSHWKVSDKAPHNIDLSLSSGGRILSSSQGSSSLQYASVAKLEQDGAEISCVARLELGQEVLQKTANGTLKVYAGPHNVTVSSSVSTYKAGSSITITCHADGNPDPEFAWKLPSRDNVEFSDSNRTITVRSAQGSHNGTYRCLVQNTYGNTSAELDLLYEGASRSWVPIVVVVVLALVFLFGFGVYSLIRK
ncbi:vascular cell adhesion protein 1-like [Paroedura picta]|uniref:vascular cell adhesion protein 1-like n=1 Tax=Paroedura picta TaxID=143630 RepID=UPI0040566052